jgi:hypothetical protein
MVRYGFSPYPDAIRTLLTNVIGAASKLGFHGKATVTREADVYVIALRVKDIGRLDSVILTDRELKRRARIERG